jgi:hypothetical protein
MGHVLEVPAGYLTQGHFGPMGHAVHQHAAVYGNEKIAFPALSQLKAAFFSGNNFNGVPRLSHACITLC